MSAMSGKIEFDESYFAGGCKGISGCDAACKILVFGLFKRNGYIHAEISPNATITGIVTILREKVRQRESSTPLSRLYRYIQGIRFVRRTLGPG